MKTALLSAGLLASGLLWIACGDGEVSAGPGGGGRPPAVVRAAAIEEGPFVARAEYVGTLEARSSADLYARSSGPVVEINADLGDRVREGQVLARIEAAEERERIEQARANLRMAEATLSQRRSSLTIARTTAERTRALTEQNLLSRQQQDSVDAELEGARAQVELAEAQVAQVRSALSSAQVELAQTRVVAPFDGEIGRRYLDRGDFAAANSPLMSVVDLSIIKTTVSLPERDAASVTPGQAATVRVASLGDAELAARVARISAVFDPDSATTRAEIEVDNPDGRLKPGMFATVRIDLAEIPRALLVPTAAVLEEDGRSWLFRVEEVAAVAGDGSAEAGEGAAGGTAATVARRLEVRKLGTSADGSRVAVEGSDLAVGDRVVVLGHEGLSDGAAVSLAGPADAAAGAESEATGREGADPATAEARR